MTTPEKPLDAIIAELRELHAKATPPEWYLEVDGWPVYDSAVPGGGNLPFFAKDVDADMSENNPHRPYTMNYDSLALIAAARNALPRLLDELEAARAENEKLRAVRDAASVFCNERTTVNREALDAALAAAEDLK